MLRLTFFMYALCFFMSFPDPVFAANLTTRHFVIINEGFSERYIAKAAESAEANLSRISLALGVMPDSTVTVVFTVSRDRFRELTEGALPDWSAAAAMPTNSSMRLV